MSEYTFPSIDQEEAASGVLMHPREIEPWLDANLAGCLFSLDDIRGDAVKFRYADRHGPGKAGIYFLQYDGDVVYVGKSHNIARRLQAHWRSDKLWTHFWCIADIPTEVLGHVEYMYIAWLDPVLNGKCLGWTSLADELIADMEPYRPFAAAIVGATR